MIYVINYANNRFRNAQKLNSKTSKKNGKDDVANYENFAEMIKKYDYERLVDGLYE